MTHEEELKLAERGKENYMCLAGLLLCDPELAQYLKDHKADVGIYVCAADPCRGVGKWSVTNNSAIYRLRPEYEPNGPMRYWLIPNDEVDGAFWRIDKPNQPCDDALEITHEYYKELADTCPEEDGWHLRKVQMGDEFASLRSGGGTKIAESDFIDINDCDRGVRWVKDREPTGKWVEYRIHTGGGECWAIRRGNVLPLHCAASRIGFGGVQFERPDGTRTEFLPYLCQVENDQPLKPVAVQFWEE